MIKKIKKNIKIELKSRNKSINDLSKALGYNRNSINRLTNNSQLDKFYNIAQCIGCSLADLFKGI